MQIEKALITDCVHVSKVSRNFAFQLFRILQKFTRFLEDYFLTVTIDFSVYKQNFKAQ